MNVQRLLFWICLIGGIAVNWFVATTLASDVDDQVAIATTLNMTCWFLVPTGQHQVLRTSKHGI